MTKGSSFRRGPLPSTAAPPRVSRLGHLASGPLPFGSIGLLQVHWKKSQSHKAEEAIIVLRPKSPIIDPSKLRPTVSATLGKAPDKDAPGGPLITPEQSGSAAAASPPFSPTSASTAMGKVHPLIRFSNRGYADELDAEAAATKPLLGQFIMDGQATMIYAAPNTGKTLILIYSLLKAIEEGLIDPNNVFFWNGDDGSLGLAGKNRLMQDAGAHMLAPGRRGMRTEHLVETMLQAATEGTARGTLIIIDTLKKVTDPMSKKDNSAFAKVCRQYVMAGGTIVALGHTRKNPKSDGTPQYQGTTDIMEDFDAVYIAEVVESKSADQRVVRFKMEKKRADSPNMVGYAYADEPGITYEEKLASVVPVAADELDDYRSESEDYSHTAVLETIYRLIEAGDGQGKMLLARKAASACNVSQRTALSVLEEHTGTSHITHLWTARTGPRGVKVYELVPRPQEGDEKPLAQGEI